MFLDAIKQFLKYSQKKSLWVFHVNTGSCNGCDIEILALFSSKYDAERFGIKLVGSPKHANILLVTGPVTTKSRDPLLRAYDMMPKPKAVVSVGVCSLSGGVFAKSYNVLGPVDNFIPVHVYVGGCSAHPNMILEGILRAAQILCEEEELWSF